MRLFEKSTFSTKNTTLLIIVGLAIVFNWLALLNAYRHASIGITTTLYHVQPLIVFFLGSIFFRESISKIRLLGLLVAFAGVVLISVPLAHNLPQSNSYFQGCGLALLAAMLYAVATLVSKRIQNIPPHIMALSQMLIGMLVLAPFADFSHMPATTWQWNCLVILGVVHSAAMYILIYAAYLKLPTANIAILSYIYPVVAIMVDYMAFGHMFSLSQIIGGVLILVASLCGTLNFNPFFALHRFSKRKSQAANKPVHPSKENT